MEAREFLSSVVDKVAEGIDGPFAGLRKNVFLFLSEPGRNHRYSSLIQGYLQPDSVAWQAYADTPAAFTEMTRNSAGRWDLLLVDDAVAARHRCLLSRFVAANPRVVVGVERTGTSSAQDAFADTLLVDAPADLDEWLGMMYRLLLTEARLRVLGWETRDDCLAPSA